MDIRTFDTPGTGWGDGGWKPLRCAVVVVAAVLVAVGLVPSTAAASFDPIYKEVTFAQDGCAYKGVLWRQSQDLVHSQTFLIDPNDARCQLSGLLVRIECESTTGYRIQTMTQVRGVPQAPQSRRHSVQMSISRAQMGGRIDHCNSVHRAHRTSATTSGAGFAHGWPSRTLSIPK